MRSQHRAGFVGGGGFEGEFVQDADDLADLVGVAGGEFASAEIDVVLESDPDISAHDRTHGDQIELVSTCAQDRPDVVVAEEPIGRPPHVHQVFGVGADSAKDAEDRLHEDRVV